MVLSKIAVILFASCFPIFVTVSAEASQCRDLFLVTPELSARPTVKPQPRLPETGVFDHIEKEKIRNWLAASSLPESQKWSKVMESYISKRVSLLPEADRPEIAAKLTEFYTKNFRFDDSTDVFKASSKRIVVPETLRSVPVPYIMAAHEMEHVIQLHFENKTQLSKLETFVRDHLNPMNLYTL